MRRAAKIDANQPAIVRGLREAGASVQPLHAVGAGVPDLLVGFQGRNYLLEVKVVGAPLRRTIKQAGECRTARELTQDEALWHTNWRGQVTVVHTLDYALEVIGAVRVNS